MLDNYEMKQAYARKSDDFNKLSYKDSLLVKRKFIVIEKLHKLVKDSRNPLLTISKLERVMEILNE